MTNANVIPIHIRRVQIEYLTDYIYLGQTLSFQNSAEKEMKTRTAQAKSPISHYEIEYDAKT